VEQHGGKNFFRSAKPILFLAENMGPSKFVKAQKLA
jgi:hypothetical protein